MGGLQQALGRHVRRPAGLHVRRPLVSTSWRPPGTVASPAITRCCAKPRPISTDCEAADIDELIPLGCPQKGQISAARLLWRGGEMLELAALFFALHALSASCTDVLPR